jgi:hypothetical protein
MTVYKKTVDKMIVNEMIADKMTINKYVFVQNTYKMTVQNDCE